MTELSLEESLSMFMAEIAKRLDENTNLIKELQAFMDFALRNQKASIKALEIQVRQMSIILHEKLSGDLRSSTETMPRVNDETISTSVKTDKLLIRRIDASQYAISNLQNRNLFSESKKMTGRSPSRLNDDHWDELKETDREKDLEGHYTNAKTLGKALNDDHWDKLKETDGEKDLEGHYTNAKTLGKALHRKEKDPWSFTLPCFINNMCFNKALADLGASVSVMPYSTYTTLGLGDLIPNKLIVELVDRIVTRPKGIVENVLVGIDKFTFPVDFIILDIPEDFKTPLILGRPFLSTTHAIINVFKAKITLKSRKLGLETRLMGDELRKNKSQDPNFKDFIEPNDPNEPIEHRRNQVKVFIPTINKAEGPRERKSTNVGGKFTNLEILKCWSLETSRWLFNTFLLINSTWRIYRAKYQGSFSF
ncbi:reverse transcriptase domain-containing protein [Tanacetum coccineum]